MLSACTIMSTRDVDTRRVIDEVRLRKQLWDASDPLYKNKDARNKSWENIVFTLYENVSEEEKQQLGKVIQQRWKTARDAYFRTKNAMKKTPSGSAASKHTKYIYYEELNFLSPSDENEVDESPIETISSPSENMDNTASLDNTVSSKNTPDSDMTTHQASSETLQGGQNGDAIDSGSSQRPCVQKRNRRQQRPNEESSLFERELLTLLSNQTPDLAPDDLAFFFSLGPILKCFDLEQKLEFRSRVLRDAMEIKNYNYRSNSSASSHSHDISSPPQHGSYTSSLYSDMTPGYSGYQTNDTTPGHSGYQTASRNYE